MAEEKKTATKKATTTKAASSAKKPATKTTATKAPAKKAVKKVEEVKVEKAPAKKAVKKASTGSKKRTTTTRLLEKYNSEVKKVLMEKYGYTSIMQVPCVHKIVINIGVGEACNNSKILEDSVKELALITGQKPVVTRAKKSIASFKLREGATIGCKVTLRDIKMYEFLDRLISISLPRVRDFRGINKNSFDGHGNYTLGVKEQLIFPEIEYDKVSKIRGMDIVIVTTAHTDEEARSLLSAMGMPFQK